MIILAIDPILLVLILSLVVVLWALSFVWARGAQFDHSDRGHLQDVLASLALFLGGLGVVSTVVMIFLIGVGRLL